MSVCSQVSMLAEWMPVVRLGIGQMHVVGRTWSPFSMATQPFIHVVNLLFGLQIALSRLAP